MLYRMGVYGCWVERPNPLSQAPTYRVESKKTSVSACGCHYPWWGSEGAIVGCTAWGLQPSTSLSIRQGDRCVNEVVCMASGVLIHHVSVAVQAFQSPSSKSNVMCSLASQARVSRSATYVDSQPSAVGYPQSSCSVRISAVRVLLRYVVSGVVASAHLIL